MKSLTFSCLICALNREGPLNLYFAQKLLRKAKFYSRLLEPQKFAPNDKSCRTLFVLETMDFKRIKDLWHTMTRRKKVSSVSSKLTIRLDRTLSRFLRPRFLNSHSPISWRMLTWQSLIQAVPSLSLKRSTRKSSKAWRKCLSNGDQGGLSQPL